jgi:hypothetical protein
LNFRQEDITAADGSGVTLKNPEDSSLAERARRLI